MAWWIHYSAHGIRIRDEGALTTYNQPVRKNWNDSAWWVYKPISPLYVIVSTLRSCVHSSTYFVAAIRANWAWTSSTPWPYLQASKHRDAWRRAPLRKVRQTALSEHFPALFDMRTNSYDDIIDNYRRLGIMLTTNHATHLASQPASQASNNKLPEIHFARFRTRFRTRFCGKYTLSHFGVSIVDKNWLFLMKNFMILQWFSMIFFIFLHKNAILNIDTPMVVRAKSN